MDEIKNKRISKDDIIDIAKKLNAQFQKYKSLHNIYEEEMKDYKSNANKVIKDIIVVGSPHISFEITMKNQKESKDSLEWFINTLTSRSREIEKVAFHYSSYYYQNASNLDHHNATRSEEFISLSFWCDSVYYSSNIQEPHTSFTKILNYIDNKIHNAPERYDLTMQKKTKMENVPGLAISFFIGIILTVGLYLFCKFSNIDLMINTFIVTKYFAPVMLGLAFLVGLIIPGKNHSLYKKIEMRKRYVGYDRSTHSDIYENDIRDFTSKCEVEIGKYSDYGIIRKQIEENYKKSKKILLIEAFVFIAICLIFIFI